MSQTIQEIYETVLKPLVEADGGELEFVSAEGDTARFKLTAHSVGSPSAAIVRTLVLEPALTRGVGRPIQVKLER